MFFSGTQGWEKNQQHAHKYAGHRYPRKKAHRIAYGCDYTRAAPIGVTALVKNPAAKGDRSIHANNRFRAFPAAHKANLA